MMNINELTVLLHQADFLREQYEAAEEINSRLKDNELIVSVMGQFKRGKSSLINRMLNHDLLPVGIVPLTTVITEIRHDEVPHASVVFEDGREEETDPDTISMYCSEEKNPGNSRKVKTVKLWTPYHPFGSGIVIADTPGVGSVNRHNTDSSYSYLKNSDVILFLLSVDSPVSESERDFLMDAHEFAARFFFAINKTDTVASSDLDQFMSYCKSTISAYLNQEITLMPVSAKTGQGTDDLLSFIREKLAGSRNLLLEASAQKKLSFITEQAAAKLELAIEAASLPVDHLSSKLARIEKTKEEIEGFADELSVLSSHRINKLIKSIEEKTATQAGEIKASIEKEEKTLYEQLSPLDSRSFEKEFQTSLDCYITDQLNTLNLSGTEILTQGYEEIVSALKERTYSAACFIAETLKEEFGHAYPVKEPELHMSSKSDFFLRVGRNSKVFLDMGFAVHLLPRKAANEKIYRKACQQAMEDVDRNKNIMLYNYRYKMQESLRSLCRILSGEISAMSHELETLSLHMEKNLHTAGSEKEKEIENYKTILNGIKKAPVH